MKNWKKPITIKYDFEDLSKIIKANACSDFGGGAVYIQDFLNNNLCVGKSGPVRFNNYAVEGVRVIALLHTNTEIIVTLQTYQGRTIKYCRPFGSSYWRKKI